MLPSINWRPNRPLRHEHTPHRFRHVVVSFKVIEFESFRADEGEAADGFEAIQTAVAVDIDVRAVHAVATAGRRRRAGSRSRGRSVTAACCDVHEDRTSLKTRRGAEDSKRLRPREATLPCTSDFKLPRCDDKHALPLWQRLSWDQTSSKWSMRSSADYAPPCSMARFVEKRRIQSSFFLKNITVQQRMYGIVTIVSMGSHSEEGGPPLRVSYHDLE